MAVDDKYSIVDMDDAHKAILGFKEVRGQHFYGMTDSGQGGDPDDLVKFPIGATDHKVIYGSRQPMPKTTRNPALEMPSVTAMKYMGQLPTKKISIETVIPKPVAVFLHSGHGAGSTAFNISTFSSIFGGDMQLTDAVARMLTGGTVSTLGNAGSTLGGHITDVTSGITNLLGGSATSLINLTKPDQTIPFLSSLSTMLSSGQQLYSNDTFATGLTVAHEVSTFLNSLTGSSNYGSLLSNLSQFQGLNTTQLNSLLQGGISGAIPQLLNSALSSFGNLGQAFNGATDLLGNIAGVINPVTTAPSTGRKTVLAHMVMPEGMF